MNAFKKAEKRQAKLRLALTGPSGSGKTFSALQIAAGIGKKIAVLDTENHSASLYADDFQFDTLEIDAPYTIQKYLDGIRAAVDAGYDVLIIDSISHAWAGEGGLLEKKGALDARGGNSYVNWAPVSKEHEHFKAALLSCDIHLIVTMRSKQDYILETNEKGKSTPKKVGLAPIQRDGMEYEFTLVLDLAMDHNAGVSKTRIRDFDGKLFTPTKKTGKELLAWLNSGVPAERPSAERPQIALAVESEPLDNPPSPEPIPDEASEPVPGVVAKYFPGAEVADPAIAQAILDRTAPLAFVKEPAPVETVSVAIVDVAAKEYKPGKFRYGIKDDAGQWYSTFSETAHAKAEECRIRQTKALIKYVVKADGTKLYKNIVELTEDPAEAKDRALNH